MRISLNFFISVPIQRLSEFKKLNIKIPSFLSFFVKTPTIELPWIRYPEYSSCLRYLQNLIIELPWISVNFFINVHSYFLQAQLSKPANFLLYYTIYKMLWQVFSSTLYPSFKICLESTFWQCTKIRTIFFLTFLEIGL